MEIAILTQKKNPQIERDEITFQCNTSQATPSRNEIRDELALKLKKDKETIVVDDITQEYGSGKVTGQARVYVNVQALRRVEKKSIIKKHGLEEKKPEAKSKEEK